MSELEALLLGIVQGLTEFLPISSSGHLILIPWLQDYNFLQDNESFNKTFDVALHAGTLVAVIGYFWTDLTAMARGVWRSLRTRAIETTEQRLGWAIVVGTIPAVIVGGLGEAWIDEHLGEPWMIAILLIVFGLVLAWADRLPQRRSIDTVGIREGFYMGVAQAAALAPGVSRSGVTISAARYLGLDRDSAARFAFLLLVPAVAGATVLKGIGAATEGLPDGVVGPMIVGTIASAASSYAAIAFMLSYVRRHSYGAFVIYRVLAGLFVLALIATGVRSATF
ncbi:MAG: undecaprenyl-diphosphatase UppP [Solirubrobacterales bacterium]